MVGGIEIGFSQGICWKNRYKLLFILTLDPYCSKNTSLLLHYLDIDSNVLPVIVKISGIYRSIQEEVVRG